MSSLYANVAIIGAGPRGTSALERLCASAPEFLPQGSRITVHIIDPFPPGGGRVWNTHQSSELLMNTVTSQVTLYTDDSIICDGPIAPGPSLYTWASENIPGLGPDDYGSRAQYGAYLGWVFKDVVAKRGHHIEVKVHSATAVRLTDTSYGRQKVELSNGETISELAAVILSQGHVPLALDSKQQELNAYAHQNGLRHVPPSNPAEIDLSKVAPGENVFLRGLGLNFFDYMALFTKGRGGTFSQGSTGLVYHPSGKEPRMFAGSRRGIPYHSRGDNEKGPYGRHMPLVFKEKVINAFRQRADMGDAADFLDDLWPLVSKEVKAVYYETILRNDGLSTSRFHEYFLMTENDSAEEIQVLTEFGVPEGKRWSWEKIQFPYGDCKFSSHAEWHSWMIEYLRKDAQQAALGNVNGPVKAALDVLRDLRNELRLIVDHKGLTGTSHQTHLDRWYTPLNAYLSIGPPRRRIEQMIALMEAGVLEVVGPNPKVENKDGAWVVSSPEIPDQSIRATTLIEARLPEPDLRDTGDDLLANLFKSGQCRSHTVQGHETGGLDVTLSPYRLIDTYGRVHPRRFAVGVPTEGVHWVTAAGARPGVNSVTLCDTDAVARAALNAASTDLKVAQAQVEIKALAGIGGRIEVAELQVRT